MFFPWKSAVVYNVAQPYSVNALSDLSILRLCKCESVRAKHLFILIDSSSLLCRVNHLLFVCLISPFSFCRKFSVYKKLFTWNNLYYVVLLRSIYWTYLFWMMNFGWYETCEIFVRLRKFSFGLKYKNITLSMLRIRSCAMIP